jgi:hypothetical protein
MSFGLEKGTGNPRSLIGWRKTFIQVWRAWVKDRRNKATREITTRWARLSAVFVFLRWAIFPG